MSSDDMTALERGFRQTVLEYHMLRPGDKVVAGLSGGADSVALLHLLKTISPEMELTVTAAHLNHNLRGQESDRDEQYCRALCERWGVPLTVESVPVAEAARQSGRSVEECARGLRYELFRRCAEGDDKVATAHTLDDSAETILLNLARGTGLRGLCGIPPVRGSQLIRPLIECTRADVEAYCEKHGLDYVTDSTNLTDNYTRNRLRHHAMPALREANDGFLRHIAEMTALLRADADYLDKLARTALAQVQTEPHRYDAQALRALAPPVRGRALMQVLAEHGIPMVHARVGQMEQALAGAGKQQLSGGWYCESVRGELLMRPACAQTAEPVAPIPLKLPKEEEEKIAFSDKTLVIRAVPGENFEESRNNQQKVLKNMLDCDRINKIAVVRYREPGDAIRLVGRGCTKTLKKLFQEAGIAADLRGRVLVIADEDGLLWVEGFGASETACAGPGTKHAILIEVLEDTTCEKTSGKC